MQFYSWFIQAGVLGDGSEEEVKAQSFLGVRS